MKTLQIALFAAVTLMSGAALAQNIPPPELRVEVGPPPPPPGPPADYVLVPGHWAWNGAAYVWRPRHWTARVNGYTRWVPGHWHAGAYGRWHWVEGHWAY